MSERERLEEDERAAQAAWDAAKPRSRKKDRHGREELLMHPFLSRGSARPRVVTKTPAADDRAN